MKQTDIGRHVAETTTDVEEEIRAFQRCCFMNGEMEEVGVALTLDEELINLKSEMKRGKCNPQLICNRCIQLFALLIMNGV